MKGSFRYHGIIQGIRGGGAARKSLQMHRKTPSFLFTNPISVPLLCPNMPSSPYNYLSHKSQIGCALAFANFSFCQWTYGPTLLPWNKATTIKFIVSHDFDTGKPTLPPGKKNDDSGTPNSCKTNFYYRPHSHR